MAFDLDAKLREMGYRRDADEDGFPAPTTLTLAVDDIASLLASAQAEQRERDAKIVEHVVFDGLPNDSHLRGFASAQTKAAAAMRQEPPPPGSEVARDFFEADVKTLLAAIQAVRRQVTDNPMSPLRATDPTLVLLFRLAHELEGWFY
jgi:hypothetical protein